jgi:hypothetical protein
MTNKAKEPNKEIVRTEKGKVEFERSKKANDLLKQGNTADMLKVMFGQK